MSDGLFVVGLALMAATAFWFDPKAGLFLTGLFFALIGTALHWRNGTDDS